MYPIRPKQGNAYPKYGNDSRETVDFLTIAELVQENEEESHRKFLQFLGIKQMTSTAVQISFFEQGKTYADPLNDRSRVSDVLHKDQFSVELDIGGKNLNDYLPLPFEIDTTPFVEDDVNYLAMITITCPEEDHKVLNIPLVGRGTFALEGKVNDAHSGYCTGGACASFQQRCALIGAVVRVLPVRNRDKAMKELHKNLASICEQYHGRNECLDYTWGVLDGRVESTYKSYMKYVCPDIYTYPPQAYFDALKVKLNEQEIKEEEEWGESMEIRRTKTKEYTGSTSNLSKLIIIGAIVIGAVGAIIGFIVLGSLLK